MPNFNVIITSPWFNILFGLITFILGNAIAYVLYRRQLQPLRLIWGENTVSVFSPIAYKLPDLKSNYMRKRVSELYVSRMVFWNAGLKSIQPTDISIANPLRLAVHGKGAEIISTCIIKENNQSNMISLTGYSNSEVLIKFDYLKHENGAIIEIVHTGYDPEIVGELKEGFIQNKSVDKGELLETIPFNLLWFRAKEPLRRRLKFFFVGFAMLFISIFIPMFLFNPTPTAEPTLALWVRVRMILALITYVYIFFHLWSSVSVPKGLYEFYEKME